jgi:hypothetical protein
MLCIVLILAMVGFFGLSIVAGMIVLASLSHVYNKVDDNTPFLIITSIIAFIGGSALVWFYNSVHLCNPL